MSSIASAFYQKKGLIASITCGDPDLETTVAAVLAAEAGGADIIELSIPFSDPTAENPANQRSALRALAGGVTTDKVFDAVRQIRRTLTLPMVFVTYANVVFSYGPERFLGICRELEIEGLLVRDLPYEEREEFLPYCRKYGVELISEIAAASEDRMSVIAKEAGGFLQIADVPETTKLVDDVIKAVRRNTKIPCVVLEEVLLPGGSCSAAKEADGMIVDNAISKILEQYGKNAPHYITEYLKKTGL